MGIKHNYTATGTDDPAKQVSVTRWNNDHVIDTEITLPAAAPSTPAANTMHFYTKPIAGRMMPTIMGPSGLETSLQPNLGGNKVALWMPPGNATTVPGVFGFGALTATGTATARTVAVTNMLTRMTRIGYVSAATAGSLAGVREIAKYTTGAGGGLGGFFFRIRFGVSDAATVAGARMFVGMDASTAAPTNVEITTKVNCIGVGKLAASNNLQVYSAGSSATSAIDLGANFPANTLGTDVYELSIFSSSAGGTVGWQVTRLNTGDTASGTVTTAYPASSTLLCFQAWRTNNATALAVGLDVCGLYIETDN